MKPFTPFLLAVCLVMLNACASSQVINGRFSTSVYAWEKFDTVGSSNRILRGYQNAQVDVAQGNISFHTYFSGATSFTEDASIRVSNAYMRWKDLGNVLDVNVGRVPVFAGVGIGPVDGALFKARVLSDRLTLTGYGGANVLPDLRSKGFSDIDKNFFLGGQIRALLPEGIQLGVSYMNRHRKPEDYVAIRPDTAFEAVTVPVSPETRIEQLVGADARCSWGMNTSGYARYDYDINTKRSIRGELSARVSITRELALTGTGIYREPRVTYNSFFTVFPMEPVREVEGGAEYTLSSCVGVFGRFGYVKYYDDQSRRVSFGINHKYGSVRFAGTNGYAGQLSSCSIEGMYPVLDRMLVPNVSFSYAAYRQEEGVSARQDIFAGALGALYRPIPDLSVDAQVQWVRNLVAQSDTRVFGRVSYWFHYDFQKLQQKETVE
jgi:hypothetical protein